jgi:hypothetical protein
VDLGPRRLADIKKAIVLSQAADPDGNHQGVALKDTSHTDQSDNGPAVFSEETEESVHTPPTVSGSPVKQLKESPDCMVKSHGESPHEKPLLSKSQLADSPSVESCCRDRSALAIFFDDTLSKQQQQAQVKPVTLTSPVSIAAASHFGFQPKLVSVESVDPAEGRLKSIVHGVIDVSLSTCVVFGPEL